MAVYIVTSTLSQNKHNITEETLYLSVVVMSIILEPEARLNDLLFSVNSKTCSNLKMITILRKMECRNYLSPLCNW
jgi:hypothetical protein